MWPGADKPPRSDRARTRHFVPLSDVLLAIAPAAGLGRVVAAPEVATALGYDYRRRAGRTGRILATPQLAALRRTAAWPPQQRQAW
jgi:hypothetical protein